MKCCFCNKKIEGYGNNPDCWNGRKIDYEKDRCCDECNLKIVIPARIKAMSKE